MLTQGARKPHKAFISLPFDMIQGMKLQRRLDVIGRTLPGTE
jgi:hypothetical protein